ncbi:hypothetical protein M436DRAFT_64738 [Aureobasidium namibiae CBS 147.97]|uniref:Uncharacterized protein n=1 Tax=Aureobasidium namibiae CBS 147.97 TaxID=1043004 RepID=A0A074WFX4_9PEZI|nr:uncharacterized protein M436DRAFT_64738 [Aureobasidium namibiae CBS 147.97]KEQ71928.1 hypothetical protein M436DRAFT_64738 [Aureobasidium namibiae CBS 147.97]
MKSLRPDELPPCFVDPNGDTIISVPYMVCAFDFGTLEMRISSDKLIAVSSYFAATLKPEWLHNKVTGTENCSDGIARVMKRYELELDQDGKDILVGKTAATDPKLRIVSAVTTIQTSNPVSQLSLRERNDRLNTMSTVNLLGFSMLCDFPDQSDHLLMDRLRQCVRVVPLSGIVQCLLGWIDYYGTFTEMRERLLQFITSEIPGDEIRRSTLFYLRVACVLRDKSFFSWILDKNPFFSNEVWFGRSSLDTRLGLGLWTSEFERDLNFFGFVLRHLQDQPGRVQPPGRGTAPADERDIVSTSLFSHAASAQVQYEYINPSILALHSIAVSQDVEITYSHHVTTLTLTNVTRWLRNALITAKQEIAQHITVDHSEPFGFRINDHNSFPWDYRLGEDTDQTLFNLIATSNPFEVGEDLEFN